MIADNSRDILLATTTQVREQSLHAAAQHKFQATIPPRDEVGIGDIRLHLPYANAQARHLLTPLAMMLCCQSLLSSI